jgi:hypothetical protein
MPSLSISHSMEPDELAYAIAGFDEGEAKRFGRELANSMFDENPEALDALIEGLTGERDALANA